MDNLAQTNLGYYGVSIQSDLQQVDFIDPNRLINAQPYLWQKRPVDQPKIFICITVYNEPGSALLASLAGIQRNLDYLVAIGQASLAKQITLCIMVDGKEKLSPSAAKLLETLDLYDPNQTKPGIDMHIFDTHLKVELLKKLLYEPTLHQQPNDPWQQVYQTALQDSVGVNLHPDQSIPPRVLLCLKQTNAGKLNSHCWFFKFFCTHLQPDYCIQMDAGSVPKANNIHDLWQFLETHPEVGAVAGSLLVPPPQQPWHLIALWQFGNFYLDTLLFRPAEAMSGYLSVLPGQFSIMRWQTLNPCLEENGQQIQLTSPLDRYFRGFGKLGVFEANMFLAEDRILCSEIVVGESPSWRLAYLPSVETVTDACQSLPELLRQRRRWINGSFACRLWLFAQLPNYLLKDDLSFVRKLSLLTSTPLYLTRSLNEWFNLAFTVLNTILIYLGERYLMLQHQLPTWPIATALIAGLSLLTCQLWLYQFGKQSNLLSFINIIYGGLFVGAALVLSTCLGYYPPLVIFTVLMLVMGGIAVVHSPQFARQNWFYLPLYFLVTTVSWLLNTYAFFNVHDCSWGTKGLTGKTVQGRYRQNYVSLWLLSNLALIVTVLSCHWYTLAIVLASLDLAIGVVAGTVMAGMMVIGQWFNPKQE